MIKCIFFYGKLNFIQLKEMDIKLKATTVSIQEEVSSIQIKSDEITITNLAK